MEKIFIRACGGNGRDTSRVEPLAEWWDREAGEYQADLLASGAAVDAGKVRRRLEDALRKDAGLLTACLAVAQEKGYRF